jgi:glycosyltransferase involved in cell wall biosynthesis
MRHAIVMVTTSYPRFPGDTVGTFMEPIALGLAGRGHDVHVVAPWHPLVARPAREQGVSFHFYRYTPVRALDVFGYAVALRADVSLRWRAWVAAPLGLAAGWRLARAVARRCGATVVHGHWVVPGGVQAALAAGGRPLVVSLHGSDIYVAERHAMVGRVARAVFRRAACVTACSEDLRRRGVRLGAREALSEVVPYGVDASRFAPSEQARAATRTALGVPAEAPLVVALGRFVRKKGFEHLIDAMGLVSERLPQVRLVLAGAGDLDAELRARAAARGISERVIWPGLLPHGRIPALLAAADVVAVPSVRDEAGNVDGLPNVAMEALASAAPVVATPAGGLGDVVRHGETGLIVPERDAAALAEAIAALLADPGRRRELGAAARRDVEARFGWDRVAERFEAIYDTAVARQGRTP